MLEEKINEMLEAFLSGVYDELNINTGDITPEQYTQWEKHQKGLATLLRDVIEFNAWETIYYDERGFLVRESELLNTYNGKSDLRNEYETFSNYLAACQNFNGGTLERI